MADESLACEARGGSATAFEELARRYQVPVLRFLQRRGCREAEDVVQETFLRAYRSMATYRDGRPFKPWLFTIAHRLSIDAARRTMRLAEPRPTTSADPSDDVERSEAAERLWATVRQTLGEEPFTAVWLHYGDGMDPRQVAAVMGRSWVWVRTTLHRARRKLADVLDRPGA